MSPPENGTVFETILRYFRILILTFPYFLSSPIRPLSRETKCYELRFSAKIFRVIQA